jgi:hypothetical protein
MYTPLIRQPQKPSNLPKFDSAGVEKWVTEQLEAMLSLDQPYDLVKSILEINNDDELRSYVTVRNIIILISHF